MKSRHYAGDYPAVIDDRNSWWNTWNVDAYINEAPKCDQEGQ